MSRMEGIRYNCIGLLIYTHAHQFQIIATSRLLTSRGIVGNASKLRIPEETPTQEFIVPRLTETVAEKERKVFYPSKLI